MQNRYVGDVGDFGKYGLLRNISKSNLTIGINWYLTPDESGNEDGKHISYLQKEDYRKCDNDLHNSLNEIILQNQRNIESVEKINIIPNYTMFYS